MKKLLMTTALITGFGSLAPVAFANSNAASTLWIASTVADGPIPLAQNTDLDLAGYEALEWTQVSSVGSHGETGNNQNILTYDTWDTVVIQKAKGIIDAGSPEIELAALPDDPGQIALRAAAETNQQYAFRIVKNDAPVGGTPTIVYNRGLVVGPRTPNGRNEDFDLEIFTLALNQVQIKDYAATT